MTKQLLRTKRRQTLRLTVSGSQSFAQTSNLSSARLAPSYLLIQAFPFSHRHAIQLASNSRLVVLYLLTYVFLKLTVTSPAAVWKDSKTAATAS
jgi:hypothetical protein